MAREPVQMDDDGIIEGEVVESAERAIVTSNRSGGSDLDVSVAIALSEAEINQQISTARRFPRGIQAAVDRIKQLATLDTETALECHYSLPRGRDPATGKPKAITGPSIRFAELCAQQWGNNRVAARVIATDRKEKFVESEGIYHDLETNYAVSVRTRRRISDSKGKVYNDDMIMVTSNAASSIALRNAILRGIPKPVWRKAYAAVEAVIRGDAKTVGARRVDLLTRFKEDLGIEPATLYKILGVKGEQDIGLDELVVAAGFFSALRNKEITVDDLLRDLGPSPAGRSLSSAFGDSKPTPHDPKTGEIIETEKEKPTAEAKTETMEQAKAEADDFPGDKPAKEAEQAKPEPEKPKEPEWPAAIEGVAEVDEVYHFAEDKPRAGKRATYKNGEVFSSAGIAAGHKVYTHHLAAPKPEPESEETTETDETEEENLSENGLDTAAFNDYARKVEAADSWLTIKAALAAFRKTEAFANAGSDMQRRARLVAYNATAELIEAGKDPVKHTDDPAFFALWLLQAEPHEVRPAFSQLVRSKAYAALSDDAKDGIASQVEAASSGGA